MFFLSHDKVIWHKTPLDSRHKSPNKKELKNQIPFYQPTLQTYNGVLTLQPTEKEESI